MDSMQITSDLMIYKIDASRCILRQGDPLIPGMSIGESCDTGELMVTACKGSVESLHYSEIEQALIVLVRLDSAPCSEEELEASLWQ